MKPGISSSTDVSIQQISLEHRLQETLQKTALEEKQRQNTLCQKIAGLRIAKPDFKSIRPLGLDKHKILDYQRLIKEIDNAIHPYRPLKNACEILASSISLLCVPAAIIAPEYFFSIPTQGITPTEFGLIATFGLAVGVLVGGTAYIISREHLDHFYENRLITQIKKHPNYLKEVGEKMNRVEELSLHFIEELSRESSTPRRPRKTAERMYYRLPGVLGALQGNIDTAKKYNEIVMPEVTY